MPRIQRLFRAGLWVGALTAASVVHGHDSGPEFIDSFDTALELHESGAMSVRHVVDVHPHGDEIRRGLFFDLPDEVGPLSDFSATLAGEPIELEFDDGAVILAAAEPLAMHQMHRFVLRYRAEAPWWQVSDDRARLRWTPVIDQFELAWRAASIQITGPSAARPAEMPAGGTVDGETWTRSYRGPVHADGADEAIERLDLYRDASGLPAPSLRHYGAEWGWRVLLGAGLLGLLGFLHTAWRAVGRDPDTGSVAMRETPPDGLSPGATRFVDRMAFDQTTFVAALASLRVKRALDLRIDEDEETLHLKRLDGPTSRLSPGERAMRDVLFEDGGEIEFGPGDARAVKASQALKAKLGEEHRGRHFVHNAGYRNWGIALGLMLVGASIVAVIGQARDPLTPDPWVVVLGVAGLAVGLVAPVIYMELLKAPTRAGATLKRQIAGLKRYFEADNTPVTDPKHFLELLPYAAALGCEEAWRDRFEPGDEADLDADTADVLAWYREFQRRHETIGVIIPIIAGSTAATAATGASAGGASAGGV